MIKSVVLKAFKMSYLPSNDPLFMVSASVKTKVRITLKSRLCHKGYIIRSHDLIHMELKIYTIFARTLCRGLSFRHTNSTYN